MAAFPPGRFEIPGFSQGLVQVLDDHTTALKGRIAAEASELASARQDGQVSFTDLYEAIQNVEEKLHKQKEAPSKLERWFSLVSPFTCVCVLLCIIFAILAWKPFAGGKPEAFLDVAKIFAGAIVGSTTSTVISKSK